MKKLRKSKQMAYQSEESSSSPNLFWEFAGEYTSKNVDPTFINEIAYMIVTLYRSEVS